MKKIYLTTLLTLSILSLFAQNNEYTFGELTNKDIIFTKEQIDSTANAVVLYESGDTKFKVDNSNVKVYTTYYFKIKIFNKEGFKHATFSIPIYNNKSHSEKVVEVKGITHNNNNTNKTHLSLNNVYTEQQNNNWKSVKFTMPNLKDNCIIEVSYTIVTPFKFNLTGWPFQSNIPKLVSQYNALIPGNYIYNRKLTGYLKLTTNTSIVKKNCFSVPGFKGDANCEDLTYSMVNIPAFKEEEYMTSSENLKSKITFELAKTIWFDGTKREYTTTWDEVDREFRTDKNVGVQLRKNKYFDTALPVEIKSIPNKMERAKAVYTFIQQHYSYNKNYGMFKDVRVKDAFENNTGNASEINISLINALEAAGLNSELVLISTRDNGFPTKVYPVITDFNYVLAKINIDNDTYLLDATDKLMPFGMLPFRCLNSYGRAMDFENESYWVDIDAYKNSQTSITVHLVLNDNGSITGKFRRKNSGYNALNKRMDYQFKNENEIIDEFENTFNNLTVTNYSIENKDNIDKPLIENFELEFEFENIDLIYFNPFFGGSFQENPFKQEDRLYPVDFGYPQKHTLTLSLELPDSYKIKSYPTDHAINFNEKAGVFSLKSRASNIYKYSLYSSFEINKAIFQNNEYNRLKELFKYAINAQKTPLAIEKINIK